MAFDKVVDSETLDASITAIAEAIRGKTGKSEILTLDDMPGEIAGITTEAPDMILPAELPNYVRAEVLEIAQKVNAVRTPDSIVFLAMSDTHQPTSESSQTAISNVHANMAAKAISYMLPLDFVAHLGDVGAGTSSDTTDTLKAQIEGFLSWFTEAYGNIPGFVAIGNHDTNTYGDTVLDGTYLYEKFTALSDSENTVFSGKENGGYCYRDFEDKKLRVFLLNTSERIVYDGLDYATTDTQKLWLAKALAELNTKSDAGNWGFIVLSHYPADYGTTMSLSNLLEVYVNGGSYTVSGETVSFANRAATFIAQFHGHIHNFLVSKLHSYATGTSVEYNGLRISIPNGEYNRENSYGVANTSHNIDFGEEQSYPKTPDTAEDTSFVVNVIDPAKKLIHSFCYGAGYDREIDYSFQVTYYSVSKELKNTTISNAAVSIAEGESYSAEITPDTGFIISGITVTMGGRDITASAVSGNTISIAKVTGDISISVAGYTNQIPLSVSTFGGTEVYNSPYGYKTGTRINSSHQEASASGMCCTGFIMVQGGDVVRIKNVTLTGGATPYLVDYTASGAKRITHNVSVLGTADNNGVYTYDIVTGVGAIRLSIGVIDDTSIITVNEEIV